ncbi:MAG TPA: protein kinase [Thermoanaerobaculia bacterium]|nr:protein kinase [Thermoanaerobaculia bacterium]
MDPERPRDLAAIAAELHDRLPTEGGGEPTLADLPPPTRRVGPYRVDARLGDGGMGEVYRGYDERLHRPVALKRIKLDAAVSGDVRERFRREARAMAQVNHRAVVQVHDWVEDDSGDWIVMELVDGRPLSRWAGEEPLPPEQVVEIARRLASGLAAAHAAGVVHRDLKAANVMLTRTGEVKILDFGIAKPVDAGGSETAPVDLTMAGRIVGTANAMSPEQALGQPVDHRSDLFSLGVLIYTLLTGGNPFHGDDALATLNRICTLHPPPAHSVVPAVPAALSALLERLLDKDPARRPRSAAEVVAALDRLRETDTTGGTAAVADDAETLLDAEATATTPATPTTAAQTPPAPGRRPGARHVLLALALLVLAAVAAVVLVPSLRQGLADRLAGAPAAPADAGLTDYELYQRANAALERYDRESNIESAIADFQRLLARDADSAAAYAGLSRAYWLEGFAGSGDRSRYDQALAAAQRAVALDAHLAVAQTSLGHALVSLGRLDEAEAAFSSARSLDPANPDLHLGFGRIAASRGESEAAIAAYRQAVDRAPGDWSYVSWLGTQYLRAGEYAAAEEAFAHSVELTPDNPLALRNLGVTYYFQGELEAAAAQFQRALEIQPTATLYTNLGTIQFAQGLYPQAVTAFERALEAGGSNQYLLWANLADAYRFSPDRETEARETYATAIQLLREQLAAQPGDPTLRSRLALYLAKRGDCEPAAEAIGEVVALGQPEAEARYRLAVASEVCGRRQEALDHLDAALADGYSPTTVRSDPELLALRNDVGFHRLMARRPGS